MLEPDLDAVTFTGSEAVTLEVVEPVDEIVLNSADLEVGPGRLEGPGGTLEVSTIRLDPETERVHLLLSGTAEPGEWTLHLGFGGKLSDQLQGFYRSTYSDDEGRTHTIATTQFESTDARRAFPCWDEPDLKAVFGVTLVTADGLLAISNGPEIGREDAGGGRVRVRFADTMPMSTYLVAFVVGSLDATEPVDVDGVPLRIVHRPGKADLTPFAAEVGAFCLRYFADYYGIPYPDKKMDMVGLPDFAQGAMENLGCITYRESLLLVDLDKATQPEVATVADVIAHELAHMWFGDLVTMRWWNGIWLNEAFATLMELLAVDAYRPDWERWSQFLRSRAVAFEVDALESTRSIEYPVRSPDDAAGMFDILTYTKGAAVLRMLEQYLGAERFREGIRRYLDEHRFGNTETHDLWDAIEKATGEPVRRIMDGWIWQGGYPLVSARLRDGMVELGQRRYLISGKQDDTVWDVPLLVRTSAGTEPVLIEPGGVSIPVADDGPVVVNAGVHAFVRVEYDDELLARLTADLRSLSTDERTQLVDDTWASVVAGHRSALDFCRFAESFADETELPVWQSLLQGLSWCERFLTSGPREHYRSWIRGLMWPAIERIGWEPREGERDSRQAAPRSADGGAGRPRGRSAGVRPRHGDRTRVTRRRSGGSIARRRLGRDRGGGWDVRGLRTLSRGDREGADAPGGTPVPVRAAGLPRRLADRSDPGDDAHRQDQVAERPRGARARDGQPRPRRSRVGIREGALGRDRVPARAHDGRLRGRRHAVPHRTRPGRGRRRVLRGASDPQSALQLQQILERQRVNEAFRRRATPELMAAFSAGPELGEPG